MIVAVSVDLRTRLISIAEALLPPLDARNIRKCILEGDFIGKHDEFNAALHFLIQDMALDELTMEEELRTLVAAVTGTVLDDRIVLLSEYYVENYPNYAVLSCARSDDIGQVMEEALGIGRHDTLTKACFPMIMALSQKPAFSQLPIRLIEPLKSMVSLMQQSKSMVRKEDSRPLALLHGYLSATRSTTLRKDPPPSVLRLHSDAIDSPLHLYSRRILGRVFADLIIILLLSRRSKMHLNMTSLRDPACGPSIKETPKVLSSTAPQVKLSSPLGACLEGLLMTDAVLDQFPSLGSPIKTLLLLLAPLHHTQGQGSTLPPGDLAYRQLGWLLGLGVKGRLSGITPVELLALVTCEDKRLEAGSLFAVAASDLGGSLPELTRILILSIKRQVDECSEGLFDVDASVRLVAPLALGLSMMGTADCSITALLLRTLQQWEEPDKPTLDWDSYLLHCALAIGLINLPMGKDPRAIFPADIERIKLLLTHSTKTPPHLGLSSRLGLVLCLALTFQSTRNQAVSVLLDETLRTWPCSWGMYPFMVRLARCLVNPNPSQAPSIDDGKIEAISDAVASLLACALLDKLEMIATDLKAIVMMLRKMLSIPAISFQERQQRLFIAILHDLVLFSWSLILLSNPTTNRSDEKLVVLRLLSDHFVDHLDHHFGRSLIQSLAAAFLSPPSDALGNLCSWPVPFRVAFLLGAIIPFPSLEAPLDEPLRSIRHLLPHILMSRKYGKFTSSTTAASTATATATETEHTQIDNSIPVKSPHLNERMSHFILNSLAQHFSYHPKDRSSYGEAVRWAASL